MILDLSGGPMYVRKDRQKLSNGQVQTYVSLAHNVWEDMGNNKKRTKPIIFSQLGVEKDLDMPVVQGMRNALDRYLIKRFGEEAVRAADRQDELARAGKLSLATESVSSLAEEFRPKLAPLRFLVTVS